jgi:hypothetical protein
VRTGNRIGAVLLGIALVVVGLVAAGEVAWVVAGNPPWPPWLRNWLTGWRETTVGDPRVLWTGVALAGIGLLLLVLQLRRWRPDRLPAGMPTAGEPEEAEASTPDSEAPTHDAAPSTDVGIPAPSVWWLGRRGVERRVAAAANGVVGVHRARAEITRGLRRWRVRVRASADPAETATVRRVLRREMAGIGLPPQVPVEVNLHPSRRVT